MFVKKNYLTTETLKIFLILFFVFFVPFVVQSKTYLVPARPG